MNNSINGFPNFFQNNEKLNASIIWNLQIQHLKKIAYSVLSLARKLIARTVTKEGGGDSQHETKKNLDFGNTTKKRI